MTAVTLLVTVILIVLAVAAVLTVIAITSPPSTTSDLTSLKKVETFEQWEFELYISSSNPARGQVFIVESNLTNLSTRNQTVTLVEPTILVEIASMSGGIVWEYQPFQITHRNRTILPNQSISALVGVPITAINQNGMYVLIAEPPFQRYNNDNISQSLEINFTITIH